MPRTQQTRTSHSNPGQTATAIETTCPLSLEPLQAMRPAGRIKQQETTMKKIMTMIAVALSLLGSVNFALAQSNPDLGAVSGSTANLNAESHDGEYHIQRGE
jgi:hypothetical protein